MDALPVTIDRTTTERGELVLRRVGERYEIISNGVFLMDSVDGSSERLLVSAAVDRCTASAPRVLIGGLGLGFSLMHAVGIDNVDAIDVVEIEPTIVAWHRHHLHDLSGAAIGDPRVSIIVGDLIDHLAAPGNPYDVICIDTDNGPNWLVFDDNAAIYARTGLELAHQSLRPAGVLAVWSASRDIAFEDRLRAQFTDIELVEVVRPRGGPDVIYLARRTAAPTARRQDGQS